MPVDRPQLLPDLAEEVEPLRQLQQGPGPARLPQSLQLTEDAQPDPTPLVQLFQVAHVHHLHLLHQHLKDPKLLVKCLRCTDQSVALQLP